MQVYRWHNAFQEGREEVDIEARALRPSTYSNDENVTHVKEYLLTDRQMCVRLMGDMLNIPKPTVREIVIKLFYMRKACAKLVPKMLTEDQKSRQVKNFSRRGNV